MNRANTIAAVAIPTTLLGLYQVYQRYLWRPKVIVGYNGYLPTHSTLKYTERPLDAIKYVLVHHFGEDWDAIRAAQSHIRKKPNPWPGIGYEAVFEKDGSIVICHPLSTVSYHSGGRRAITNYNSLGLAFAGDFSQKEPNAEQLRSFFWYLKQVKRVLPQQLSVGGHRDAKATQCPGEALYHWLRAATLPKGYIKTGGLS